MVKAGGKPDRAANTGRSRAANFWCHVTEGALATFGGGLAGPEFFQVLVLALRGTAATLGTLQSIGSFAFIAPLLLAPHLEAARRKKRLVLGLGLGQRLPLLLTAGVLALLATKRPLLCLYAIGLVRLGGGFATSLLVAPWQDLIAETVPIQRVGRLFGFRHFLSSLLQLPSAVACGAVIAAFAFPLNFELLYVFGFGIMMASWWVFSLVEELPEAVAPRKRQPARHYFRDLIAALGSDRNYRRYLYFQGLGRTTSAATGFLAFAAVRHHGLGMAEVVALAGVLGSAARIGGNLILPFLAERVGPKCMLAACLGLRLAGMLLAALAPTGEVFLATFFVLGLSAAAQTVAGPPFMMRVFPRGKRIGYMTLAKVAVAPLAVAAPVTAGLMMNWVGYRIVFAAAGIIALSALVPLAGIALAPESATGPDADRTQTPQA